MKSESIVFNVLGRSMRFNELKSPIERGVNVTKANGQTIESFLGSSTGNLE